MKPLRSKNPVAYSGQTCYAFYNRNGTRGLICLCKIPNPLDSTAFMWGVKVAPHSVAVEKGATVTTFGNVTVQSKYIGLQSEWQAMLVYVKGDGEATQVMYPAWPKTELKAAGPFINHSSAKANVRLVRSRQSVRFVATKRIEPNAAILTKYGSQYARLLGGCECQ